MDRRAFLGALALAAALPREARAQPAGRVYKVGYLQTSTREQQLHLIKAFEESLRDLGYRVGQNVVIEYRFAQARLERLPELAADLVRLKVDVIVTGVNSNTIAAKQATTTIPIVMANGSDPVGAGLVASLARPGGNITGLTSDTGDEITGKRVELLKEILPKLSRVAVLWNPDLVSATQARLTAAADAARKLRRAPLPVEARGLDDLERAFASMIKERAGALVVLGGAVRFNYRGQIGSMATRNRLPAIAGVKEYAEAGLLLIYGVSQPDLWRRAATYVDKILKGAKPADLPVEQPTKFELVINLKTAKALGLTLPQSFVARADEVIQ
jgi:putative ABC transport system substrate-binding protein